MSIFLNIIIFIASIIIAMVVHEFGHLIFAKIFKVNVLEYSIGIGPKIFSFKSKKGRIRWSLRPFLIAAYVSIDSSVMRKFLLDSKDENKRQIAINAANLGYKMIDSCKLWQKILIYVGGVAFNFITFGLFIFICYVAGYNVDNIWKNIDLIFETIFKLLTFQTGKGTGVGLVSNVASVTEISTPNYGLLLLSFCLSINLSLGIVNLVPLPPLDGFKILSDIIKGFRKKPISEKSSKYLDYLVFALLMYFIIAILVSEVRNFYK